MIPNPPPGRAVCDVCGPIVNGYHRSFMCRLFNGGLRCALGFHAYGHAHRPGEIGLRCQRCQVESWLPIPPMPASLSVGATAAARSPGQYGMNKIRNLVPLQVAHYLRTQRHPELPEWYETRRKTTLVVFWA